MSTATDVPTGIPTATSSATSSATPGATPGATSSATPAANATPATTSSMTRAALERLLAGSPFQRVLGLELETFDIAEQTLTLRSVFGPQVERAPGTGQYHGGVIASLIDIAGDFALIAVLGHGVPTINFRVDYLRPALNTDLLAGARVRRAGRTIGVVDIDVTDSSGRLIALGRGCYGTQAG